MNHNNEHNNWTAFVALLANAADLDGKIYFGYAIEKAGRYLEGKDSNDWKWGLSESLYGSTPLPVEAYMGADEDGQEIEI